MKVKRSITLMLGALLVSWLIPQPAEARRQYNPKLKRFMQRDPLGTTVPMPPEPPTRIASGVCQRSKCVFQEHAQPVIRAGSGYGDGLNLYGYLRSSPVDHLDPLGLSSLCGNVKCGCCGSGDQNWPVHGNSTRARIILLGGDGCVTLLIPKGIFCTGSCSAIKDWEAARGVPILQHECCHACEFEDHGLCGYRQSWIPGDLTGYCNDNARPATPDW